MDLLNNAMAGSSTKQLQHTYQKKKITQRLAVRMDLLSNAMAGSSTKKIQHTYQKKK